MHDTGTALAGVAPDMGAGEIEMISQQIDEESAIFDVNDVALPLTVSLIVDTAILPRFFNWIN